MYEIIGYRRSEGVSKKTGKPFAGYVTFLTIDQTDVTGLACEQVFLSDQVLEDYKPQLGDRCRLHYNRQGFLQEFELVV